MTRADTALSGHYGQAPEQGRRPPEQPGVAAGRPARDDPARRERGEAFAARVGAAAEAGALSGGPHSSVGAVLLCQAMPFSPFAPPQAGRPSTAAPSPLVAQVLAAIDAGLAGEARDWRAAARTLRLAVDAGGPAPLAITLAASPDAVDVTVDPGSSGWAGLDMLAGDLAGRLADRLHRRVRVFRTVSALSGQGGHSGQDKAP
ncbi:hypothetical protein NK718_13480 [Alsobacter sp. SYSU M60028]|uniref:Flagellar hook-length control protein FliK n=1 Tax=Alsobacter ponti TaxID=2962936 RepID=A0ABT1LDF6_9HYPH|nr:hypothetical protein [Alsobacter ponti]MCP8939532.1 hypothetical protein [Alsobacter ponti]